MLTSQQQYVLDHYGPTVFAQTFPGISIPQVSTPTPPPTPTPAYTPTPTPTPSYTPAYSTGGTITPTSSSSFLSSSQFAELQALEAQRAAELEAARKRKAQLDAYITQVSTMIKAGEGTKLTQFFNTIPNEFRTEVTSATNYSPSGPASPAPGTVYNLNGQQVYDSYNSATGKTITRNANTGEVISNTGASASSISPTDASSGTSSGSGTNQKPGLDPSVSNLSIYNLDSAAWETLVPSLKPGTPEFQAAMDEIETSFYYNLIQMVNAQTEQEKAVADYNWNTLRESIKTNLGITLSKNAIDAWSQIQGLKTQYGAQNIGGSGLEAESIDTYLRKVRASDAVERLNAKNKTEEGQVAYMRGYASSDEINKFVQSNPELARQWGLIPSDATKQALSFQALKQKFPGLSDEEINKNIAMFFDENGNYRSSLYQKQLYGKNSGVDLGTVTESYDQYGNPYAAEVAIGDTGTQDILAAQEQYKRLNALASNIQETVQAEKDKGIVPKNEANQFIAPKASPVTGSTGSTSGTGSSFGTQTPVTPPVNQTNPQTNFTLPSGGTYNTSTNTYTPTPAQVQQTQAAAQSLGGTPPGSSSSAPAPITQPKTYATLYDYYSANGGWNTWDSARRQADAKAAGIPNYTGSTIEQNKALLAYLSKL